MSKLTKLPKYFNDLDETGKLTERILRIENWIESLPDIPIKDDFAPKIHKHAQVPEHAHLPNHTHDKKEEKPKPKPWWKNLWNR